MHRHEPAPDARRVSDPRGKARGDGAQGGAGGGGQARTDRREHLRLLFSM